MTKMFDIKPPVYKKPAEKPAPSSENPKKSNNSKNIFFAIILFVLIIIGFSILNNQNYLKISSDTNSQNELEPIETLVTNSPEPSLSIQPDKSTNGSLDSLKSNVKETKIILLNGSRDFNNTADVKNIIEQNNLSVSEIGDTKNIYSNSTIYYTNNNVAIAQKIKSLLPNYNVNLVEDEIMASDEKIIVIVSKKNED